MAGRISYTLQKLIRERKITKIKPEKEVIFRDRAMMHALAILAARYDRDKKIEIVNAWSYIRDMKIIR